MTLRISSLVLFLLIASSGLVAQLTQGTPPEAWTMQIPNTPANAVVVDASGVYVTGCIVAKLNKDGNQQWITGWNTAQSCSEYPYMRATGLAVYGTALHLAGSQNGVGVVEKYDAASGGAVWHREITGNQNQTIAVAADATGVYAAGTVWLNLPGQTGGGQNDAYVQKYDADGNVLWTSQFGWQYDESGDGIASDGTYLYVAGESQSPLPGQYGANSNGFLRKIDAASGQEVWTLRIKDMTVRAITIQGSAVYTAGYMWGTGWWDAFVRKYDMDGNVLWTRPFTSVGTSYDYGTAIAADATGVYVSGKTMGTFPGFTYGGAAYDAFVGKFDPDGNLVWTYQLGTNKEDTGDGIAPDGDAVYFAKSAGWTEVVGGWQVYRSAASVVKLNSSQLVPALTLPENQTVSATDSSGAVVTFTATATDWTGAPVSVSCDPASGSTFPLGATNVNCSATDVHTNRAKGSFTITVSVSDTPPTLTLPADLSITATAGGGAYATYSASATDTEDGTLPVNCSPASGSLFGAGTTTVNCSATDTGGHFVSGTFHVTVTFAWSNFLQPINLDDSSIFKLGSTIPVKFRLLGDSAPITNLAAKLYVAKVSNSIVGDEVEATSTSAADAGNTFRYDSLGGVYIFNWGTKSLSAGTYQIKAEFNDGVHRTLFVSLRK